MEIETLENIEAYFQRTMVEKARTIFEERIIADKEFADNVAFYIAARNVLKQELIQKKNVEWIGEYMNNELTPNLAPVKKIVVNKWWSYVAAACILLFVAFYFFEKRNGTPQQIASNYVTHNFSHISLTMDGAKDSIGLGKAAYNNKNYDNALQYFVSVANAHSDNNDAKKLAGIVYLFTGNYDNALQKFDELANVKGLFSNPGVFYKAVALMQRNKGNDLNDARKLLQQVVNENLDGRSDAEEWLKKF